MAAFGRRDAVNGNALKLRGEDCIGFDDIPQPKQTTMVSRSFGTEVRYYDELANAIAMFATDVLIGAQVRRRSAR